MSVLKLNDSAMRRGSYHDKWCAISSKEGQRNVLTERIYKNAFSAGVINNGQLASSDLAGRKELEHYQDAYDEE